MKNMFSDCNNSMTHIFNHDQLSDNHTLLNDNNQQQNKIYNNCFAATSAAADMDLEEDDSLSEGAYSCSPTRNSHDLNPSIVKNMIAKWSNTSSWYQQQQQHQNGLKYHQRKLKGDDIDTESDKEIKCVFDQRQFEKMNLKQRHFSESDKSDSSFILYNGNKNENQSEEEEYSGDCELNGHDFSTTAAATEDDKEEEDSKTRLRDSAWEVIDSSSADRTETEEANNGYSNDDTDRNEAICVKRSDTAKDEINVWQSPFQVLQQQQQRTITATAMKSTAPPKNVKLKKKSSLPTKLSTNAKKTTINTTGKKIEQHQQQRKQSHRPVTTITTIPKTAPKYNATSSIVHNNNDRKKHMPTETNINVNKSKHVVDISSLKTSKNQKKIQNANQKTSPKLNVTRNETAATSKTKGLSDVDRSRRAFQTYLAKRASFDNYSKEKYGQHHKSALCNVKNNQTSYLKAKLNQKHNMKEEEEEEEEDGPKKEVCKFIFKTNNNKRRHCSCDGINSRYHFENRVSALARIRKEMSEGIGKLEDKIKTLESLPSSSSINTTNVQLYPDTLTSAPYYDDSNNSNKELTNLLLLASSSEKLTCQNEDTCEIKALVRASATSSIAVGDAQHRQLSKSKQNKKQNMKNSNGAFGHNGHSGHSGHNGHSGHRIEQQMARISSTSQKIQESKNKFTKKFSTYFNKFQKKIPGKHGECMAMEVLNKKEEMVASEKKRDTDLSWSLCVKDDINQQMAMIQRPLISTFCNEICSAQVIFSNGLMQVESQSIGSSPEYVISADIITSGMGKFELECEKLDGWGYVGIMSKSDVLSCDKEEQSLSECPSSFGWSNEGEFFRNGKYHFESGREWLKTQTKFQVVINCLSGTLSLRFPHFSDKVSEGRCHTRFIELELSDLPKDTDWCLVLEWMGFAKFNLEKVNIWSSSDN